MKQSFFMSCIYEMIHLFIMLLKGAAHSQDLSVFQFLHLPVCLSALTEIYMCVLGFEALLEFFDKMYSDLF